MSFRPPFRLRSGARYVRSRAVVPAIVLRQGADFYVRVNDPRGVHAARGRAAGASILLAIRPANGRVIPIPATAFDEKGFDCHLRVPVAVPMAFIAQSNFYSLRDSRGAAISSTGGLVLPVSIPAGQAQHKEAITIP